MSLSDVLAAPIPRANYRRVDTSTAIPGLASKRVGRKGDVRFWRLYDEFSREHTELEKLNTPLARQEKGSPAAIAAHEAWQVQLRITDAVARRIATARTYTLEGMLAKIQVTGFVFDWVGRSFQHDPDAAANPHWEAAPRHYAPHSEEQLLIISLRADLLHLHTRGGSR
ncbi:hypothetical protein BH10PSE11_BH10PSE11_08260 [soil metagenome]